MSILNEGEVTLKLGDHEYILRPTLRAMQALSRSANGMRGVLDGLFRQDFDVVVNVIRAGANVQSRDLEAVNERVFAAGVNDPVLMPLIQYVQNLMNGGKPPQDTPATEDATRGEN